MGWAVQSELHFCLSCNRVLKPQACNCCQLWNAHVILPCSGRKSFSSLRCWGKAEMEPFHVLTQTSPANSQPVLSLFSLWGSNSLIPARIFFCSLYLILRQILLQFAVLPRAPVPQTGRETRSIGQKTWLGTWRLGGCSEGRDPVPSLSAAHLEPEQSVPC